VKWEVSPEKRSLVKGVSGLPPRGFPGIFSWGEPLNGNVCVLEAGPFAGRGTRQFGKECVLWETIPALGGASNGLFSGTFRSHSFDRRFSFVLRCSHPVKSVICSDPLWGIRILRTGQFKKGLIPALDWVLNWCVKLRRLDGLHHPFGPLKKGLTKVSLAR